MSLPSLPPSFEDRENYKIEQHFCNTFYSVSQRLDTGESLNIDFFEDGIFGEYFCAYQLDIQFHEIGQGEVTADLQLVLNDQGVNIDIAALNGFNRGNILVDQLEITNENAESVIVTVYAATYKSKPRLPQSS